MIRQPTGGHIAARGQKTGSCEIITYYCTFSEQYTTKLTWVRNHGIKSKGAGDIPTISHPHLNFRETKKMARVSCSVWRCIYVNGCSVFVEIFGIWALFLDITFGPLVLWGRTSATFAFFSRFIPGGGGGGGGAHNSYHGTNFALCRIRSCFTWRKEARRDDKQRDVWVQDELFEIAVHEQIWSREMRGQVARLASNFEMPLL